MQEKKFRFTFVTWHHVTSWSESCDFMGDFLLSLVTTLQSLVIIDLLEEEILSFQFFK